MYRDGHTLRGHFSIGTIGPRESVLCSQRSSDVIRVQSPWECVKYRDKGKNNRGLGPRRVWSFTNVCVCECTSVQYISKTSARIRKKFAEYVEFDTRTNRLDFDEDPISGKRIFRTISNISNINVIADQ